MSSFKIYPLLLALVILAPFSSAQTITETYRLTLPKAIPPHYNFGVSSEISIDGRTVLAVAPGYGAVAYERRPSGEWDSFALATSLNAYQTDPRTVALSGDGQTALVGVRFAFSPGTEIRTGAVSVFRRDETGWYEEAILVGSDAGEGDTFGYELDISDDGTLAVVGSWYHNHDIDPVQGGDLETGGAYLFSRDEAGDWSEVGEFLGGPEAIFFGTDVAISGDGTVLTFRYIAGPPPFEDYVLTYRLGDDGHYELSTTLQREGAGVRLSADGNSMFYGPRLYLRDPTTSEWLEDAYFGEGGALFSFQEAVITGAFEPDDDRAASIYVKQDGSWVERARLAVSDKLPGFHYYSHSAGEEWALFSVAGRAVYVYDLAAVLVASDQQPISVSYNRVGNVQPNPFRDNTRFVVKVEQTQHVEISLFDSLGRLVKSIFRGVLLAQRSIVFTIDQAGLVPGTYFVRVTGEEFDERRSVTLLR